MTDELLRSAALGVVATLLGFELIAAARSWFDGRPRRPDQGLMAPWLGRTDHRTVLISQAFALRGHFAERRDAMNMVASAIWRAPDDRLRLIVPAVPAGA